MGCRCVPGLIDSMAGMARHKHGVDQHAWAPAVFLMLRLLAWSYGGAS